MKAGDRIVLKESYGSFQAGDKGVVTRVSVDEDEDQSIWLVSCNMDNGRTMTCFQKRLEVVKESARFKAGDKVKVVKTGYGFNSNEVGKTVTLKEYATDGYGGKPGWTIVEMLAGSNNNGGKFLWFGGYHGEESFEALPEQPVATFEDAKALIEAVDSLEDAKAELVDAQTRVQYLEEHIASLKAKLNIQ